MAGEYEEGFVIDSPDKLMWFMKKRGAYLDEETRVRENSERILERLRKEREEFETAFDTQLMNYLLATQQNRKVQYIDTLYGRISFRKVSEKPTLRDEAMAREYIASRPEYAELIKVETVTTESLDKKGYLSLVKYEPDPETGELAPVAPPGVEVVPGRTEVVFPNVKVKGGSDGTDL